MSVIRQALQRLRGARHIEWVLLAVALSALFLLTAGAGGGEADSASLERRMEQVLSLIEGAGEVRVLVHSPEAAEAFASGAESASGVLVVAEGAGSLKVSMALQRAVQALLGVEAEQIEILTMKEGER